MNIAQLSEQLKDVPQNRLIGYAQNPNSVVPQFLALAEIQRRQHLQAQAQPAPATVAEDVLGQANPQVTPQMMAQQLPENQPGVAQLPTGMPQGMASGGIVAFAGGGLQDEETETEDKELARLFGSSISFDELAAAVPAGIRGLMSKLPKSYEETKRLQGEHAAPQGSHKYESAVIEEAKRQGIDPNLALHVLYKETGNLKDPESARSKAGALGVMQLMPGTAKELGVNPMDPYENIRGGVSYLKRMYDKYGDYRTAAAAYNAGPGNVDKALRRSGGLDTLSGETRNYIAGLAAGGSVKRYADGGSLDNPYAMMGDIGASQPNYDEGAGLGIGQFLKRKLMGIQDAPVVSKPSEKDWKQFDDAQALFEKELAEKGKNRTFETKEQMGPPAEYGVKPSAPQQAAPTKTRADLLMEEALADINARAAKAKDAGDMNLYLSLMQAGLGMMASKSPYALSGIGEGGQAGISTYATLRKQQADEEKDILASRLGLAKYGLAAEQAQKDLELKRDIYGSKEGQTEAAFAQRQLENTQKQIAIARDDLNTYTKDFEARLLKRYPQVAMGVPNPKYDAELQAFYNSPEYLMLKKAAYPNLPAAPASTGTGGWSIKQKG